MSTVKPLKKWNFEKSKLIEIILLKLEGSNYKYLREAFELRKLFCN